MCTKSVELLFEEHKSLIKSAIWRNRPLLSALRLEDEDISQQLSITMLSAIQKFDPDRSVPLAAYISCSLQYEILNIKRRHKPHGVTGVPSGIRVEFRYLDDTPLGGGDYELPLDDDMTAIEFSELFDSLSEPETEAVTLKMQGYPVRRMVHTAALDRVSKRYTALYM